MLFIDDNDSVFCILYSVPKNIEMLTSIHLTEKEREIIQ